MKTNFTSNMKDNVAAAILLSATFIAIAGSIVSSNNAHAVNAAPKMEVQRMETILITAPRVERIVRLETVLVTASRQTEDSTKFMVAAK